MKRIFKTKQFISALMILSFLFSAMIFETSAVDKNEVESNNTAANATVTYDDYDNYGKISSSGDVDWWQITFTSTGNANFWIGDLPSNCVYFLELYESDGSWKIAESKRIVSDQQLIRAKVYSGVTYKIKIYSYSGYSSSSTYKLRIKNYTETQDARVYTTSAIFNYQTIASTIMAHTSSMGYNDIHRHDYSSTKVYNQIDDMNVAVITATGEAGKITLGSSTYLVANTVANDLAGYKGIGNHASAAMEEMRLICFQSAYSGITSSTYGNLVDKAREKAAMCCLGWQGNFLFSDLELWNDYFFGYLDGGGNVGDALNDTKMALKGEVDNLTEITSIYFGTSQLNALTLG